MSDTEDVGLEDFVMDLIGEYSELHAAMLDLIMTLRTIKKTALFLYLKKAIITISIDKYNHEGDIDKVKELKQFLETDDPYPDATNTTLSTVLATINTRLEPLDFEISESKDMDDSSITLFSFVNKRPTGAIRLSTKYSQNDIQLVKQVIDRIFASEFVNENTATDEQGHVHPQIKYSVPCMKMIKYLRDGPENPLDNDTPIITRFSLDESDLFLKDLETYGWLERHHNNYTLGCRGLVELKKYLIDTYGKYPEGTVSICFGCGDVLTRGLACPNAYCHVKFHPYCCDLVKKTRDDDSCPHRECSEEFRNFYTF